MDDTEIVTGYHEATKHHPRRYARSAGYLDWDTQPEPFRRFIGAETVPLPLDASAPPMSHDQLLQGPRPVPMRVTLESLGVFFRHSLAVSAWKEAGGSRWALRCNPSSGNLHPTEGYLAVGPVKGLCDVPTTFHYAPDIHALEARTAPAPAAWSALVAALPTGSFLAGMSSIHWREAWKYGERAFRYCQHDAGHALAALSVAAGLCGWRVTLLDGPSDDTVSRLFGLREGPLIEEGETPELLALVTPEGAPIPHDAVTSAALDALSVKPLPGMPNRLSPDHVDWKIIDAASAASRKPALDPPAASWNASATPADLPGRVPRDATALILQRRSAQAMDGRTALSRDAFHRILAALLPAPGLRPWDTWPHEPRVHLALFVHRVEALEPGLYVFPRSGSGGLKLRECLDPGSEWSTPPGVPDGLPLRLLRRGDFRDVAAALSCAQDIASDGCFCAAMLAEFDVPLRLHGPWQYRRLFWETGLVGQVLYLEAEAEGIQGTGIGCYFDDETHRVLGLRNRAFQSLYHFTAGGALADPRITTLPAYERGV
jgi:SagB-type dehydrogenase family enzyme